MVLALHSALRPGLVGSVDPDGPAGLLQVAQLQDAGVVRGVADDEKITSAVSLELTAGHSPGHAVVRIRSGGEQAIMLGHLALTPLNLVVQKDANHVQGAIANGRLRTLLEEDAVFIGPLWPAPGAGRWNGKELVPHSR